MPYLSGMVKKCKSGFKLATVAVCGLGGLGSNIAISLARAGIGKPILIDFDEADITNLHRQRYKVSQIGQFKTEALADNLREINPYIEFETHTAKVTEQNAVSLFEREQRSSAKPLTMLRRKPC